VVREGDWDLEVLEEIAGAGLERAGRVSRRRRGHDHKLRGLRPFLVDLRRVAVAVAQEVDADRDAEGDALVGEGLGGRA
jgi:hypothetical protein